MNHRHQTFLGVQSWLDAAQLLSEQGAFVYTYLASIDHAKSTGVVKYHILYDAVVKKEGDLIPTTFGAFEEMII